MTTDQSRGIQLEVSHAADIPTPHVPQESRMQLVDPAAEGTPAVGFEGPPR